MACISFLFSCVASNCFILISFFVETHLVFFSPIFFYLSNYLFIFGKKMYEQEQFFKDQIKIIHESRDAKEESFERLQQEQREKVKQSHVHPSNDR